MRDDLGAMPAMVLFDIDGVMLSEERYFDASALTVHELLYSPQYLGLPGGSPSFRPDPDEPSMRAIRQRVFADDAVLYAMKRIGINANWDMVYLQTAYQLLRLVRAWTAVVGVDAVQTVLRAATADGWTVETLRVVSAHVRQLDVPVDFAAYESEFSGCTTKPQLFEELETALAHVVCDKSLRFDTGRALWTLGQQTFQEWYLGDAYVPQTRQPGKHGFLLDEVPIIDPPAFGALLQRMQAAGVTLGIGTGRPSIETRVPLDALGWLQHFSLTRISTASDVLDAEHARPEAAPLGKPNPFSYLRSYLATDSVQTVLETPLPLPAEVAGSTLVIGDSVADLLAARALGCRFAAVLTGLEGEAARAQFEELGCDYIWSDVLNLVELFPA